MRIYIIQGATGEYSDRAEWLVGAFKNEDEAKKFVIEAEEISRVHFINYKASESKFKYSNNATSHLDPQFKLDYTGTFYNIIETELT